MLALTYRGPGRVRVESKPDPRIEHPGDALVRITRTTICGSDLHLYHGLVPDTRVGSTFGHEFTGVVEELGPAVEGLTRGDRVVVPFNIACGACWYCQRGITASCDRSNPDSTIVGGVYGYSHTTGGYDGGQAEYVRVPFADVGPMRIPDDMTDEEVLFLSDILPTGWQGAEMGQIQEGDTVVVFGCGPVGLFAQKAAQLQGAGRVIAVDHVDYRLELARRFAGAETVKFDRRERDPVSRIRALTDGRGADVAIDAVGLEADGSPLHHLIGNLKLTAGAAIALNWAIDVVRKAGTVSVIGVYGPPWNLVDMGAAMNKGLTIRLGQCSVRRHMELLLGYIRDGRLKPLELISHRLPLEDASEAYRMFARKQDDVMKCVLVPPSAGAA